MGLDLKFSTTYPLAQGGTVRAGTIGLYFSNAGNARYVTAKGDDCQLAVVAGQTLETGLLASASLLPPRTLGLVGR